MFKAIATLCKALFHLYKNAGRFCNIFDKLNMLIYWTSCCKYSAVKCKLNSRASGAKRRSERKAGARVTNSAPLTYTYLDCLLAVKMRGHKMAEI